MSTTQLTVTTGKDATDELVSFLERFFDHIDRDVAEMYDYTVARADGELVGVAATKESECGEYWKLAFLHVSDTHQRHGVASQIVDAVSRESGRESLLAKCHIRWTAANRFYQSNGWEKNPERSSRSLTAYVKDC